MTTQDYINSISTKVQQVLKRYDSLKKENAVLKENYEKLKLQQEELKQRVDEMRQQELLLKASAAPLNPEEKKELKVFFFLCKLLRFVSCNLINEYIYMKSF